MHLTLKPMASEFLTNAQTLIIEKEERKQHYHSFIVVNCNSG